MARRLVAERAISDTPEHEARSGEGTWTVIVIAEKFMIIRVEVKHFRPVTPGGQTRNRSYFFRTAFTSRSRSDWRKAWYVPSWGQERRSPVLSRLRNQEATCSTAACSRSSGRAVWQA